MSVTSSSSSTLIPAEGKLRPHGGWKQHAAWVILGLAFLLGSGVSGSVAIHSSRGLPTFMSHITSPANGRAASRTTGSTALAERVWTSSGTTNGYIDGGPPIP